MFIGITGTDGAGKGAVVNYLVKKKGYTHLSSRALIIQEVEKRGLTADRDTLRAIGNDMRREHGHDVIVQEAFKVCADTQCQTAVIESLRAYAEVVTLKEKGGILLAVDADRELRYSRIVGRGLDSDHITFEKFKEQEAVEMDDPDPAGMQKAKVIAAADHVLMNNGSMAELHQGVDAFLEKFTTQ